MPDGERPGARPPAHSTLRPGRLMTILADCVSLVGFQSTNNQIGCLISRISPFAFSEFREQSRLGRPKGDVQSHRVPHAWSGAMPWDHKAA